MTAAARAALLAAGNDGRVHPASFPVAGMRPATLNSGYLYLPPGASAAWAAAGARFGHLGSYPLSLTHTTLSYPYSLSTHAPGKVTLETSAAMRGLSVEALREAHLGMGGKLAARPNGGLFSPARDIDGIRGQGEFNVCNISDDTEILLALTKRPGNICVCIIITVSFFHL